MKGMSILKYLDSFKLHCRSIIGVRNIPLEYIIRGYSDLTGIALPPLLQDEPHSAEYGSIEAELIYLTPHNHSLFRCDNADVYNRLEIGLRGSPYAPTIVRFRNTGAGRTGDGCGAFSSLVKQHAGPSVWEARVKGAMDFLTTREWTGTSSVTFEKHADGHRAAYVAIIEAREHISYQLMENRTRVTYLLDSIKCKDPEVLSAVSSVRLDDPGMRDDFESAANFLLPTCPVAKRGGNKKAVAEIAAVNTPGSHLKNPKGKTGVELRWYPKSEFKKLTKAQKKELSAWSATNPRSTTNGGNDSAAKDAKKSGGGGTAGNKRQIAGVVKSVMKQQKTQEDQAAKAQQEMANGLLGLVAAISAQQKPPGTPPTFPVVVGATQASPQPTTSTVTPEVMQQAVVAAGQLQSILKSKKKSGKKSDKSGDS
jgi:hypothetical protein